MSPAAAPRPFPTIEIPPRRGAAVTPSDVPSASLKDPLPNLLIQAAKPPPREPPALSPLPGSPGAAAAPPPPAVAEPTATSPAPGVVDEPAAAHAAKTKAAKPTEVPTWLRAFIAGGVAFALARATANQFGFPPPAPLAPIVKWSALAMPGVKHETRLRWATNYRDNTGWASEVPYAWPTLLGLVAAKKSVPRPPPDEPIVCRIAGIDFTLNDFCRHWLITGKTGSAKTASGVTRIIHELCRRLPGKKDEHGRVTEVPFGGAIFDAKGVLHEAMRPIFRNYGREDDLVVFQTRPRGLAERIDPEVAAEWAKEGFDIAAHDHEVGNWTPKVRINLLGNSSVPPAAFAQMLYDVARAMGGEGGGQNPFFPMAARDAFASGIVLCRATAAPEAVARPGMAPSERFNPKLDRLYMMLRSEQQFIRMMLERGVLAKRVANKKAGAKGRDVAGQAAAGGEVETNQFEKGPLLKEGGQGVNDPTSQAVLAAIETLQENYFGMAAKETFDSIRKTLLNWLSEFQDPDILEVFAADDETHSIQDIDRGKILCISIPQRLKTVRRYIATIMKELCYFHGLCRFDLPDFARRRMPLAVIFEDEFQELATDSDKHADKMREGRFAIVAATQGTRSLHPVLQKQNAEVLEDNMCNRLIFACNSAEEAESSAKLLGKREVWKVSHSSGAQGSSNSKQKEWRHWIEPDHLRQLKKYHCVVHHADGAWRRAVIPVLAPNGRPAPFFLRQIPRLNLGYALKFKVRRLLNPAAVE